jgi:uncharacterized protein
MSNLHIRFPQILSFALALLFLGLSLIGTPIGSSVEKAAHLPVNSGVLIQQFLLALFSALAVTLFCGWKKAGFNQPITLRGMLLTSPVLVAPVIMLFIIGFAPTSPLQVGMLIIFTIMIGFAEEALCRGVMLNAFLPGGPMRAAVISSVIFGSMHLIYLFYGMSLSMALLYLVYASLLGFGFAAPYLRNNGAIWPLVIMHALVDLIGKLGHGWGISAQPTGSTEAVIRLFFAALVASYGFWLLRKKQIEPRISSPVVS